MTDIEARLAALEDRVRLLEDHNAIMRLLYAYGPAVDSGSAETVAQLWTEDGYTTWTPAGWMAGSRSRPWCARTITRNGSTGAAAT